MRLNTCIVFMQVKFYKTAISYTNCHGIPFTWSASSAVDAWEAGGKSKVTPIDTSHQVPRSHPRWPGDETPSVVSLQLLLAQKGAHQGYQGFVTI